MSTGNTLRTRIRALFRRAKPELEGDDAPMPPDPEWDELLDWAEVCRASTPQPVQAATQDLERRPDADAPTPLKEQAEEDDRAWAAAIASARQRQAAMEAEEEAEWAAAIEKARRVAPPGRPRPTFARRDWEERIERIRARAAELERRRRSGTMTSNGASLRERIDRLAARVAATASRRPESEQAAGPSEEDLWQVAIQRAKTGNA
jgi:hypothetical protein